MTTDHRVDGQRGDTVRSSWAARERTAWADREAEVRRRLEASAAARLTHRTLAWFPVRVWRHFLQHNGFLLAAGVSYQALFALSAAIYVVFAAVGLWLGGSTPAMEGLIALINGYLPGLIAENGLLTTAEVARITASTTGVLSVTGLVALLAAIWTSIGWVTFSRRAVRDIFGLTPDLRNYFLLKARDLLAAVLFGFALVLGGLLTFVGTWALDLLLNVLSWHPSTGLAGSGIRVGSVAVSFLLNAAVLAALFRFLAGTTVRLRRVMPGALVGGAGLTVLQLAAGLLLSYTPSNPLLATFALAIGLLLWFRLVGVVVLVAASWVAVSAEDHGRPIRPVFEEPSPVDEHEVRLDAAILRYLTAQSDETRARWWEAPAARRAVRRAEQELARVAASDPRRAAVS